MRSFRSYSMTEVAESAHSFLETVASKIHSLISRHTDDASRGSDESASTYAPSHHTAETPPTAEEASILEVQGGRDFDPRDTGQTYTRKPDDENDLERKAWLCFALERELIRRADFDDILQDLKWRMERDKAQLKSWGNSLSRQTCLLADEKSRSRTEQGRKDIDAWTGCLDREYSRYRVEEHKLRGENNNNLTTFLSRNGLLHLLKRDAYGWLLIPEEEDYLPLWRRSALRSNDT
jgi:hypothetical protein